MAGQVDHAQVGQSVQRQLHAERGEQESEHLLGHQHPAGVQVAADLDGPAEHDDVEGEHEALRAMSLPGEAAWIPAAMRPIAELASGEQAHVFVRGLTLAHLDATLRGLDAARGFLDGDVEAELAKRGVEAIAHP